MVGTKLTHTDKHNIAQEFAFGTRVEVLAERYNISTNYIYIIVRREVSRGKIPAQLVHKLSRRKRGKSEPHHKSYERKPKPDPAPPQGINQGDVVRRHKDVQRGFVIPPNREKDYIELLKKGLSRKDAHDQIWGITGYKI